jgi:uroporphyrinogen decarboxylase
MTHRERARIALTGGVPDYVPTFELVFHETERDFGGRTFYGGPSEPDRTGVGRLEMLRHNARLYIDIARRFEHSIIMVTTVPGPAEQAQHDLEAAIKIIRDKTGDEFFIVAHGDATLGIPDGSEMEGLAYRIVDDPDGLKAEAQQRVNEAIPRYERLMKAGLDGFALCADYAFNAGPFLSPAQFAQFVAPYLAQIIAAERQMGAITIKHTDGNIEPILDQIVAANPHALHSIDPMAGMDIKSVKERFGDQIALCGNVHCALMQTGTPQQIRQSAEYCLTYAKPEGGYVFSTSNCVFRGMPLENYDLIHNVWLERRRY